MKRTFKWLGGIVGGLLLAVGVALGGWHLVDDSPDPAEAQAYSSTFDVAALHVLVDGDMAGTAYADRILHPIADAKDQLITVTDFANPDVATRATDVPNTVMGWPGSMTASADRSLLYVVTAREQISRDVVALERRVQEDMPRAQMLSVIDAESGAILTQVQTCFSPLSVDIAPNDDWLLIACGDNDAQLQVFALEDGNPVAPREFALDVPAYELASREPGARFASIHPSGTAAGVVLHNRYVTLVRFESDENGIPTQAQAEEPQDSQGWLSMSRWTRSGGHLIVADVAWGPGPTDALLNGNGRLLSYALSPDSDVRGIASEAVVSRSPESMEFNREGNLIAVVNMERSYLPGGFLSLAPGRSASSLSLVEVASDGSLTVHGEPVGFRGVLPEDVAFDADGDQLAVVVYQDHDAPRSDGWLAYFEIAQTENGPRIVPIDKRTPLPRGGHDLLAKY